MAKVNIKSEEITPFGGIYYASKAFYALQPDCLAWIPTMFSSRRNLKFIYQNRTTKYPRSHASKIINMKAAWV